MTAWKLLDLRLFSNLTIITGAVFLNIARASFATGSMKKFTAPNMTSLIVGLCDRESPRMCSFVFQLSTSKEFI